MPHIWFVRVPTANDGHDVSNDVCRDLELLLEHSFQLTQIFHVTSRHEVTSVHHQDNVTFLMAEHARVPTSHSESAVALQVGVTLQQVSCCGQRAVHRH